MNRKDFINYIVFGACTVTNIPLKINELNYSITKEPIIYPRPLKKGDTIGLFCPSGPMKKGSEKEIINRLKQLGFNAKFSKNFNSKRGFLAGTDSQRVEDLHELLSDDKVHGIMCIRGGYGAMRILPLLDYSLIRSKRKILIGFSDVTALLYAMYSKAGLVGYHGPVGIWEINKFSQKSFLSALTSNDKYTIGNSDKVNLNFLVHGNSKGVLVGGNLSLMTSLIGTPFDVDFSDKIVFIEDVEEAPYRIDRMLAQLFLSNKFKNVKGVILGKFLNCFDTKSYSINHKGKRGKFVYKFEEDFNSLDHVLKEWFSKMKVPVVYNFPLGHVSDNCTLPFGGIVTINSYKKKLIIHSRV